MSKRLNSQLISILLLFVLAACTSPLTPSQQASASPAGVSLTASASDLTYPIVDTGQGTCYDNTQAIPCPAAGEAFYGQDAHFIGNAPSYYDHGDGTVTDTVTGLMWSQSPDLTGDGAINAEDKLTYAEALAGAETFELGGYDDWRLPTTKELYSLIDFSGLDPSGPDTSILVPFIDTTYFDFAYGDGAAGERTIDAQFASSTLYGSTTMGGNETMFGVNFADGRIKGYPATRKTYYVLYVRGNPYYGENDFVYNPDPSTSSGQDRTITDNATGLMWAQDDSGVALNWEEALAWVEQMNAEAYLGYSDWRLPNAKALQSIVDYSRAPDTTGSAAIDPLFNVTSITNEAGELDFPSYWSSTTHASQRGGYNAVYVVFGRAMGNWQGRWTDVHGAGAQRSDPKAGDPIEWASGNGPQGDAVRIEHYVRLVRGGEVTAITMENPGAGTGAVIESGSPALPNQAIGDRSEAETGALETPPELPQEAFNACEGVPTGDGCIMETPHGQVDGTCRLLQRQVVCVPESGPPSGKLRP
jgi:hypothetical protein